jgi:hypothetical protein
LAILVQTGIAHYDLRKFRVRLNDVTKIESKEKLKEKKLKKKATEREFASEESSGEAEDKIEKDVINSLVEQLELPDVDTLQAFLKKDFESLDELQFLFLQSVLKDLWVLQKWNQPLNYAQERKLSLTETHLKHLSDDEDNRLAGGVTSQSLIPKGASLLFYPEKNRTINNSTFVNQFNTNKDCQWTHKHTQGSREYCVIQSFKFCC